jgi:hypothetical protein
VRGAIPAVDEFMITMRKLIKLAKLIAFATLAFVLAAGTVLVMKIRPALCVQACQPLTPRCGGWPGNNRVWSVYFCADRAEKSD